ncbi:MAG: D-alanyl-D-alanine carboxypeptidase [Clostridium sp.]|nr:D-alanyl-D-alanine carboxypeptidase [Clostridium sp.]
MTFTLMAPFMVSAKESAKDVDIVSQAAIVMDYETGEIIYEKNANDQMYLASTSKLMTALLFAEHNKKTDSITYTESAKAQPEYSLDWNQMKPYGKSFTVGDTLTADTVMKGLLLFSGNDVAYMIADAVGGNSASFANQMNEKASELGLKETHFENPNGLPKDGQDVNYSTAYELALITKKAYENDWIRETLLLSDATVMLPKNTQVKLENRNTELGKNGNVGGKTGVTDKAGTCFAGVYEKGGKKYITVVLKCNRNNNNTRFEDIATMMDYSADATRSVYKKAGEEVGTAELEYKAFRFFGPTKTISAPIVLSEDAKLYDNNINNSEAQIIVNSEENNAWKVASQDQTTLTLSVKQFSTEIKGHVDISTFDLIKANILLYIAILVVIVIIVVLILFISKMIANRNRRKNSYNRRRRY